MAKTSNINNPRTVRVPKEYAGEYIAWRSWLSRKIIAHNQDPSKTYEDARKTGAKEPVIMFVPDLNMVSLY